MRHDSDFGAPSRGSRLARGLGIAAGTVVILAIGAYVPATLLGPLPPVTSEVLLSESGAASPAQPVLAAAGASAVSDGVGGVLDASAGASDPLPMAGIAKIVAALVLLDEKPLEVGAEGPDVPIGAADYQDYIDYSNEDARTVLVFPEEKWSQLEMLQALVLGSSNNHADTLARWAFGSVDGYVTAANAWLAEHGLTGTTVVDATGLSSDSRGTAHDLAALATLAMDSPVLAQIIAEPAGALANQRGVVNTTEYLADEGFTGISRSYTDDGGVCFLYSATVPVGAESFTFSGVYLGEPDYDTLETDALALIESARAGVAEREVVTAGTAFGRYSTEWGAVSEARASSSRSVLAWQTAPVGVEATLQPVSTAPANTLVGSLRVAGSDEAPIGLRLSRPISDPGLLWRLTNPVPVISALVGSWTSEGSTEPTPAAG